MRVFIFARFNKELENFLDEILLLVAMVGVYTHCFFSAISGFYRPDDHIGVLVIITSVLVLIQVRQNNLPVRQTLNVNNYRRMGLLIANGLGLR